MLRHIYYMETCWCESRTYIDSTMLSGTKPKIELQLFPEIIRYRMKINLKRGYSRIQVIRIYWTYNTKLLGVNDSVTDSILSKWFMRFSRREPCYIIVAISIMTQAPQVTMLFREWTVDGWIRKADDIRKFSKLYYSFAIFYSVSELPPFDQFPLLDDHDSGGWTV